jgi:soluble lytic murein transglycosylase-like protein
VSESLSIAFSKPATRGITRTLILGALCITAAMTMHDRNGAITSRSVEAVVHRQILTRLIDASGPVQPSAYDEESSMSRDQLLDRWDWAITEASQRFHIPKAWIRAVMARESGGRTMLGEGKPIVSRAGAVGLMQVLPATYDEMAAEHRLGDNPFDARDNIMAGTAYLRWLHRRYGYPAMFAAYNAGPAKLEDHLQHGARLPAETRAYVGGITKALHGAKGGLDLVRFTRPDGVTVKIDPDKITAIRAPLPGEYDPGVKSVLTLGYHRQQAVCENITAARAAIRATRGAI